ncbi:hypothetical protein COCMIDRAFT_2645 [Bipolaris oryzae ATCC 44560]|uniref:CNNM transmembrane domain-containing protein n=1 Tax=Bipolaris oryzae ATCC 44560 TaxID=930090 RepID=W6ZXI4_COCMI|nr:uncharacterized protein COCMIDRAFT_2645 [Bipolaris oryzae ATCC 44560]EUC48581.1 hypothetical protein COCMIDRAFT_2645 [Bipolaris oryzae ATCC 44560]
MALSASRPRVPNGSSLPTLRLAFIGLCHAFAPMVAALPMPFGGPLSALSEADGDLPKDTDDPQLWLFLGIAVALVLAGGVFAGLTIALMGQDEIYLQVLASSGEKHERKNAKRVLKLLERGKHWVLVTLLLSNVITNETLPIVLDRSLGGGWPAVVSSTVLIVIFGEVVPQSICVRYGLPIGAAMSPIVLGLMYIMGVVAWPTAKLLDYLLGEDHGTVYKKGGLKTLVSLHQSLGLEHERLNEDEVTIITAVLDLKAKAVGNIMTPMKDVFTMSSDTVLDEKMMDSILSAGYSRIPIHTPENENNFVGMLLVKMLITYDPEDALRVRDFALATLPETRPETSCLDILNFFQEGKSHMVLVSEYPAEARGAVGVVTLEDVIEELIGEEIIDESDVFIDVHKAIRRMAPAPRARVPRGKIISDASRKLSEAPVTDTETDGEANGTSALRNKSIGDMPDGHPKPSFMLRRRSSGSKAGMSPLRSDDPAVIEHLKHLGPSNAATRPKQTRINTVKIKPGSTNLTGPDIPKTIPEDNQPSIEPAPTEGVIKQDSYAPEGGVGEGLLSSAGREASDGVLSVAVGYGTMAPSGDRMSWRSGRSGARDHDLENASPKSKAADNENSHLLSKSATSENGRSGRRGRSRSVSTIASLRTVPTPPHSPVRRHTARSGSISENIVDVNGIKKIVLETTSSSDTDDKATNSGSNGKEDSKHSEAESSHAGGKGGNRKRRKKRGKKKKGGPGDGHESQPLLGDN